jgi:hypothetical protein
VQVAFGAAVNYVGNTIEAGAGMAGRIWQTREPLVVDDVQHVGAPADGTRL